MTMTRTNKKTHSSQQYFIPTELQRELDRPLNDKGFLRRGTHLTIRIEHGPSVRAVANGHGSIKTENEALRHWFAQLAPDAQFTIEAHDGILVFSQP